jgi:putative transposase
MSGFSDMGSHAQVLRYIHRNPVKRGLVEKPEDCAWSSYRHYATGAAGTVVIESKWTAFRRGNRLPDGWEVQKNVG